MLRFSSYFRKLGLVAVLALVVGSAESHAKSLDEKFDEYLTAAARVQQFQGAALVARNGEPLFAKGYGYAEIATKLPISDQTVFLIGSVTKQFTATAIMQLVEQGRIALDSPLTAYLRDYPAETGNRVTIRHLLNHTSGIPSYTGLPQMLTERFKPVTPESLLALFHKLPLEFEPGTKWNYSNSGYVLLGMIIEKVSGESYPSYLRQHIFDKLGMNESGYFDPHHPPARMSAGHMLDSLGNLQSVPYVDMSWPLAAGGLYSTVHDLAKWDKGMIDGALLNHTSLAQMMTPGLQKYGFGLMIDSLFDRLWVSHGGDIDGFTCEVARYPDDSLCVIVLSNNGSTRVQSIAVALAAIAFGQPYDVPVKKTPLAMDSLTLQQYVGVYEVEAGSYRVITRSADTLYSQRDAGMQYALGPESTEKFFFPHDNAQTLTFLRDNDGKVDRHVMRASGKDIIARRIEGSVADSVLQSKLIVSLDPAILAEYVGQYELMPGFVLELTVVDGKIFGQATGQPQIELSARAKDKFVIPQVGAEISFDRDTAGKVISLTLRQAGQVLPGKRIK